MLFEHLEFLGATPARAPCRSALPETLDLKFLFVCKATNFLAWWQIQIN